MLDKPFRVYLGGGVCDVDEVDVEKVVVADDDDDDDDDACDADVVDDVEDVCGADMCRYVWICVDMCRYV